MCLLFKASGFSQVVTPVKDNDDNDNQQNQNIELLSEQNQDENADYTSLIEGLKQIQVKHLLPIRLGDFLKFVFLVPDDKFRLGGFGG